jgi:hypothetical protein
MLKLIPIALVSAISLVALGCQSDSGGTRTDTDKSMSSPSANLVCDKCGTVAMRLVKYDDKGRPIPPKAHTAAKGVCPDCDRMAGEDHKIGTTQTCDSCGGQVKVVASGGR